MRKVNRIITHPARWFRQGGAPEGAPPAGNQDPPPGQGDAGQGPGTTPPPAKPQGNGPEDKPAAGTPAPAEPTIPKARFDEVLEERNTLAEEKKARERKDAEERGDHERIAAEEKERGDKADAAASKLSRTLAFREALHEAKVVNVGVALKLAIADGLLDRIKVDPKRDYQASAEDAAAVVQEMLKDKEVAGIINPASRSFGDDAGGRSGDPAPQDPSKMSPTAKIARGFEQTVRR